MIANTNGWNIVPLKKVITKIERSETPVIGKQYRQIGVRLWGEGVYERESIDGSQTQYKTLNLVAENDIIINKIWARNGSVAVVPESLSGCYGSNEFPTFTPMMDKLNTRWFHWLTKTPGFWAQCDEKSRGTSGKNRIRPERFLEVEIPLPPLAEQNRIVARIEELTGKIEEARRLSNNIHEETKMLHASSLDNAYAKLSAVNGCSRLEAVCTSITDGDHLTPRFSENGVKFIFVGNVSSGTLHFENCKYVTPDYYAALSPMRRPKYGDVLYSSVGATLGVPALIDSNDNFCFQRHIAILKPNRDLLIPKYLWYMMQSATIYAITCSEATGSAQPTVPLRAIRALPIPVPSMEEQHRVLLDLNKQNNLLSNLACHQRSSRECIDSLLPSILDTAFSGRL